MERLQHYSATIYAVTLTLTFWEEALHSLCVVLREGRGGGAGAGRGEGPGGQLWQLADALPHLVPGGHGLARPVELLRDVVTDLVLPHLPLPGDTLR